MIKKLCIILMIFSLMVGCQQTVVLDKPIDQRLYVNTNKTINYVEYMRRDLEETSLHDNLYTHKLDYMMPIVFYYIPMNSSFESKKDLERYFDNWLKAVTEETSEAIQMYIENTSVENYVKEQLEKETIRQLIQLMVLKNKGYFLEHYDMFSQDIWSEIQNELHVAANDYNKRLLIDQIPDRWQSLTHISKSEYVYLLCYYNNSALEEISLSDDASVIYYKDYEKISELYGSKLIQGYVKTVIKNYPDLTYEDWQIVFSELMIIYLERLEEGQEDADIEVLLNKIIKEIP